jgi:Big-like domain-containing protein/calcineurin-like phosphoesterase family protein
MDALCLFLAGILMLSSVAIIDHNNFTYAETNITTSATTNASNTTLPAYLTNESNYFFVKYIQSDWKTGIVNKTAQFDSNQNAVTVEYNNSTYYATLTDKEEKSLKLALFDIHFFRLPHGYPMTLEAPTDNVSAYNLTATINNLTNSVYWIDKQNDTVPSGLFFLKDRIESWLQNATLIKQENPTTTITPSCGPIEGFNFNMMANGFAPNRTLHWELLDKDHQPTLLGYFETNSTGGFNQTSDVSQILPGKYLLHVFDDVDNDAHEDFVGKETFTSLSYPCEQNNNATNAQANGVSGNAAPSVNPATPVNTPPVAKAQSVTTNRDTAVSINLDATDKDGDSLTYSLTSSPKQGSLSSFDKDTGSVLYTPKSGYTGNDGFTFTTNDKSSTSNSAKVSISVNSVTSGTSKAFSMAAAGDWGCTSNSEKTVKKISSEKPNIVLALGDYSYEPSADCWLEAVKPIDDITKITIGNHEDSPNEDLDAYMSDFGLNKQFYSFTKNYVHFVVMATEIPYKSGSDQYKFVANDLSKASTDKNVDWIVVFMHRIMYTSPTSCSECEALSDLRETYHPLFDKYGVDLVLQGHAHDYQRSYPLQYDQKDEKDPIVTDKNSEKYNDPKGEIYAIVGTGGEDFHALKSESSFIASQHDSRFGHLKLDTSKSDSTKILNGQFIGNDGKFMDQFQILSHQ